MIDLVNTGGSPFEKRILAPLTVFKPRDQYLTKIISEFDSEDDG